MLPPSAGRVLPPSAGWVPPPSGGRVLATHADATGSPAARGAGPPPGAHNREVGAQRSIRREREEVIYEPHARRHSRSMQPRRSRLARPSGMGVVRMEPADDETRRLVVGRDSFCEGRKALLKRSQDARIHGVPGPLRHPTPRFAPRTEFPLFACVPLERNRSEPEPPSIVRHGRMAHHRTMTVPVMFRCSVHTYP